MKIKIIDLLNMNENKLPNRIKVFNTIFEIVGKNYYATSGDYENMNLLEWVHDIDDLNEQVEIKEENKKIEKITMFGEEFKFGTMEEYLNYYKDEDNEVLICRVIDGMTIMFNKVIDEVNKLIEKEK